MRDLLRYSLPFLQNIRKVHASSYKQVSQIAPQHIFGLFTRINCHRQTQEWLLLLQLWCCCLRNVVLLFECCQAWVIYYEMLDCVWVSMAEGCKGLCLSCLFTACKFLSVWWWLWQNYVKCTFWPRELIFCFCLVEGFQVHLNSLINELIGGWGETGGPLF